MIFVIGLILLGISCIISQAVDPIDSPNWVVFALTLIFIVGLGMILLSFGIILWYVMP